MAVEDDRSLEKAGPPVNFASKEGLVLASIALYVIFYFMLTPYGFRDKLDDPDIFKYYSIFFVIAFTLLLLTGLVLIYLRPTIIQNELLGMFFFLGGGVILFIVPFSMAAEMDLPVPGTFLTFIGGVLYAIGMIILLRDGGYFTPWLVGLGLTLAVHGHEAAGNLYSTGHMGPIDQLLWNMGLTTIIISIILFVVHIVKMHYILVPMIQKGTAARRAKKYEEALRHFDNALKYYPKFPTALNNKGNVLFNLGRFKESRECYERALKIDPYYRNAERNLMVLRKRA